MKITILLKNVSKNWSADFRLHNYSGLKSALLRFRMDSTWRWNLALAACGLILASCSSLSPVPTPTLTPVSATAAPTPTIVWFPPTNTPPEFPTQPVAPTLEYHPGVGALLFSDSFDQPELWNTSTSSQASAIVTRNRLVLSIDGQGPVFIISLRSQPAVGDFYAEATVDVSLCSGSDQYGMLFHASPGGNYYRFAVNCNGQVRLERSLNGETYPIQNWLSSGDATFGAPAHVGLGVWAVGNEMRLFLNDSYQFTIRDPLFHTGTLGFFIYASGKMPVTASFSNLSVYSVAYIPPTPTVPPTLTPKP